MKPASDNDSDCSIVFIEEIDKIIQPLTKTQVN